MGNCNAKSSLRNAIVYLNISADEINLNDDKFWAQIWNEDSANAIEVLKAISLQEIRMLRDGSSKNFAYLTYKMVEKLYLTTGTLCNTHSQQTSVLNATRILTKLLPSIFEDKDWRNFFYVNSLDQNSNDTVDLKYPKNGLKDKNYKAYLPYSVEQSNFIVGEDSYEQEKSYDEKKLLDCKLLNLDGENCHKDEYSDNILEKNIEFADKSLLKSLILSICDLLFCPEFTVLPQNDNHLANTVDAPPEDLKSLLTCEYVWEPGVGFDSSSNSTTYYDKSRIELLRLLLTCFSETLYYSAEESIRYRNYWIETVVSSDNRHALPLFTSLLNTIFIYKPCKITPFNRLLFSDNRQELVELCVHIMIATLDYQINPLLESNDNSKDNKSNMIKINLFIEYLTRIHRIEDLTFLVKGFARLLNNCLEQNYLLSSTRNINFDQELLTLLWMLLNLNNKFVNYLLKSNDILYVVVPILHHLNENFQDSTKSGLIHIGVFNLLILSGERNFGVRLNKPYSANVLMNLPTFTGSHADLLIIVFHKLILYGYNMNQIIDYLLTIVVNMSPYIKALSMLASNCLIQLFEIFSSPYIIFTEPNLHKLVVLLLEIFNNLVQYQFDGNANLVYVILNHKVAFLNLSNLPASSVAIKKVLNKLVKRKQREKLMIEGNKDNQNMTTTMNSIDNNSAKSPVSNQTSCQSSSMTKNIEVSLIETPNINQVTSPTHLLNDDVHEMAQLNDVNNNNFKIESTECTRPSISFDDILNDDITNIEEGDTKSSNDIHIIKITLKDLEDHKVEDNKQKKEYETISDNHQQEPSSSQDDKKETEFDLMEKTKIRWKPTPNWVREWKKSLPLQTILRMIEVLIPQVDRFKIENDEGGQPDALEIIKFLQNGTLVGLLPVPHPIMIRKYHINKETTLWFRICTWATIYLRQNSWTGARIRLIKIL